VVKSDAEEAYVRSLALYLDERISEVQNASRPASSQSLAVLAALNIADELFRERRARAELRRKIKERSRALLAHMDREVFEKQEGRN
jgi:cell division protein ZapA